MDAIPKPFCGHSIQKFKIRRGIAICGECQSFWDLNSLTHQTHYDSKYAEYRFHNDPDVGAMKVRSLQSWLDELGVNLKDLTVCEVGFGGGHCLKSIQDQSKQAFGIEVSPAHLENAAALGIRSDHLFRFESLPSRLESKIDLWIFQDSFEHLPNPAEFVTWMKSQSSETVSVLIIAPRADSPSRKLMGKLWPHRLADHTFHWSTPGLASFFKSSGFELVKSINPKKYVSLGMILSHVLWKFQAKRSIPFKLNVAFRFNIGQQGLLFGKTHP